MFNHVHDMETINDLCLLLRAYVILHFAATGVSLIFQRDFPDVVSNK